MKHDDNTDVSCDVWRLVVAAARSIDWSIGRAGNPLQHDRFPHVVVTQPYKIELPRRVIIDNIYIYIPGAPLCPLLVKGPCFEVAIEECQKHGTFEKTRPFQKLWFEMFHTVS